MKSQAKKDMFSPEGHVNRFSVVSWLARIKRNGVGLRPFVILTMVSVCLIVVLAKWPSSRRTALDLEDIRPEVIDRPLYLQKMAILKKAMNNLIQKHPVNSRPQRPTPRERNAGDVDWFEEECADYKEEMRKSRTVVTNIWEEVTTYNSHDIAVVSMTTKQSLGRAQRMLKHWRGPVSLTLYIRNKYLRTLPEILSKHCPDLFARRNIDLHVVVREGVYFPYNYLRNVALNNTRAAYVQILDIDFIPSIDMYDVLLNATTTLNMTRTALITAAFELGQTGKPPIRTFPRSKQEVVRLLRNGLITPFKVQQFPMGWMPTEYPKWIRSRNSYTVDYRPLFEPYVALQRDQIPPFDQRFIGRARDKIAHVLHLYVLGCSFGQFMTYLDDLVKWMDKDGMQEAAKRSALIRSNA